ncbi:MAG: SRPBCC family protein [Bacteroidetes bacterium]|nr:SRPBCC family protein [Bacteroidota bacterium]
MEAATKTMITVETSVHASTEKAWGFWTKPEHIVNWNNASPDWHTPEAKNDLRVGGKFSFIMAAKDGSLQFDFNGVYDVVKPFEYIEYTIADGRKVKITFSGHGNETKIVETFEAENENPVEMQKMGWQAILNSFKAYVEGF